MIPIQIGSISTHYHLYRTTAPQAYDGFGTISVDTSRLAKGHGEDVERYVLIDAEHLTWQVGRYASGLHAAAAVQDASLERMCINRLWQHLLAFTRETACGE